MIPKAPRFGFALLCLAFTASQTAKGASHSQESAPFWFPALHRTLQSAKIVESRLADLPPTPDHENRGACLGYHSEFATSPDTTKEIQIDTGEIHTITSVFLVPAQIPGLPHTASSYGFPKRFRLDLASTPDFADPIPYANFTSFDFPDPGRLPVEIRPQTPDSPKGRYVRLQVTRLSGNTPQHFFALGEFLIFGDGRRLLDPAHPDKVQVTDSFGSHPTWRGRNLLDLQSCLGPAIGSIPSPALGWRANPSKEPPTDILLTLDLGSPQPITEIRLHPALPPDFPRGTSFAFPKEFLLETSLSPDFTSRTYQFKSGASDFPDPGNNPVSIRTRAHTTQFIRLRILRTPLIKAEYECALSEIEVFSENRNLALHRPVVTSSNASSTPWNPASLTDGFNSSANLIDFKSWLSSLSQRRILESELATLLSDIQVRSDRSQSLFRYTLVATLSLSLLLTAFFAWRARYLRQRDLLSLRQRIARDLHDEIGSNLGTIAMLSQIALAPNSPETQVRSDLREIASVAQQSVDAIRDLVWLLQRDSASCADFIAEIRITAQTLLPGILWSLEADQLPPQLPFDVRRNAFLALKEMLHNAAKHAAPTHVEIRLFMRASRLTLSVTDNGKGFDPNASHAGVGLHSLRARAEALGGNVQFQSTLGQGSTIHFEIPFHS